MWSFNSLMFDEPRSDDGPSLTTTHSSRLKTVVLELRDDRVRPALSLDDRSPARQPWSFSSARPRRPRGMRCRRLAMSSALTMIVLGPAVGPARCWPLRQPVPAPLRRPSMCPYNRWRCDGQLLLLGKTVNGLLRALTARARSERVGSSSAWIVSACGTVAGDDATASPEHAAVGERGSSV